MGETLENVLMLRHSVLRQAERAAISTFDTAYTAEGSVDVLPAVERVIIGVGQVWQEQWH